MDFQLIVVSGRSVANAHKLADGVTTVGRHDDCQIRIRSSQVSRKHCELFEKKGLLLVKDLGSSNGTFVNGKKIDVQQVLQPGDELAIGPVKLKIFKAGEAPPAAATAAPPPAAPGDTAVVEAIALADPPAGDEEFEIDFDDLPEPAPAKAPEPAPAKAPEPAAKSKPKPAAAPAPAADDADEAIADFLLDIKLDDE